MTEATDRIRLDHALSSLPTASGGTAIVMATAGSPPAMALLSTGDVWIDGDSVAVVTYRNSSVSQRLGEGFTLLVPATDVAFRVEAVDATSRSIGLVELIEAQLGAIHRTAEQPWLLDISFRPDPPDDPAVAAFVAYWADIRTWLQGGAAGEPPHPVI